MISRVGILIRKRASYESGAAYAKEGNITLYAVWNRKVFKIAYAYNDGTVKKLDEVTDLITDQSVRLTDTVPARDRFRFCGWHEDAAASENQAGLYESGAMYSGKEDIVLYAIWAPEEISVSLWLNYGSGAEQLFDTVMMIGEQGIVLPEEIPEREGYVFRGWDPDPNAAAGQYGTGDYYIENQDLYATWVRESSPLPSSSPSSRPAPQYIMLQDDGAISNVYSSLALMGMLSNGSDNSVSMDPEDPSQSYSGKTSMQFSYQPPDIGDHWSGVMMLLVEGNYQADPGEKGPDLSKVSKMVFNVKGSGGSVRFFVECDGGEQIVEAVNLQADWQQVTLELDSSWSYCNIPFGWSCNESDPDTAGGKIEFWVDGLRFE